MRILLLSYMQYYIDKCDPERGETFKLAKHFGQQLIDNTREVVGKEPLYKDGKCTTSCSRTFAYDFTSYFPHCAAY